MKLLLLAVCLAVAVGYVVAAARVTGNNDNDAAYYLGVARYIARTKTFAENIVWTFIGRPASVIHHPFTHWQGLTSIVLVPVLMSTQNPHAPFVVMALISGVTLLLLWYLVTTAAPLRYPLAQGAVLFVFATSPAMLTYRLDTDTVPPMQLWLVASLVALAVQRWKTAASVAFLMVWTRGDGAVLCVIVWLVCIVKAARNAPLLRARTLAPLLAYLAALCAVYAVACLLVYGAIPPRGMRLAPRLVSYYDLYAFGHAPELIRWRDRIHWPSIQRAFWTAIERLRTTPFSLHQELWLGFLVMVGFRKVRWRLTSTVWLLLFVGSSAIVLLAGVLFSNWRTLYPMLPLASLALGAAIDDVLGHLDRLTSEHLGLQREALAALAATAIVAGLTLGDSPRLALRNNHLADLERDLRELSPTLAGGTVASVRPWSVIATTESPAVMIPNDGETAFADALDLYGVRWLIVSNESCTGTTEVLCAAIRDGTRRELGPFRLEEHSGAGHLRLFRVEGTEAAP